MTDRRRFSFGISKGISSVRGVVGGLADELRDGAKEIRGAAQEVRGAIRKRRLF
jgi:hypothetical protein